MRNALRMQTPGRWISFSVAAAATFLAAFIPGLVRAEQPAPAESPADLNTVVRASMRAERPIIQAGKPVWVDFNLTNLSENRLTLRVPELSQDASEFPEMGLPVNHVFSGVEFKGPRIDDEQGQLRDPKVSLRPKDKVPAIKLAPHGSVGVRLDLARYYPSLARPGKYNLVWQPYNGSIASEPLAITVLAERQAIILTDLGKITMRFHYDQAPNHVQNFIELIDQRFYDNLTFNRIIPGGLVQGGDQLGNRRGVRPDGKRLKAEFSNVPFEIGTVGMARSSSDPDSASSQFFICLARQPSFDGKQTAFGYLVGEESMATLRRIAAVPTEIHSGLADYPKKPVYIRAISLESVPTRERRIEQAPITPPASQPSLSFLGQDSAAPKSSAAQSESAAKLLERAAKLKSAGNSDSAAKQQPAEAPAFEAKPQPGAKLERGTEQEPGGNLKPAAKSESTALKLPGLRAQGRVGRRVTTAPASK